MCCATTGLGNRNNRNRRMVGTWNRRGWRPAYAVVALPRGQVPSVTSGNGAPPVLAGRRGALAVRHFDIRHQNVPIFRPRFFPESTCTFARSGVRAASRATMPAMRLWRSRGTGRGYRSVPQATDAPYPHCNSEVLHAPGTCKYCDLYPDRQSMRSASGTPFTPAEANGWGGNVAVTP